MMDSKYGTNLYQYFVSRKPKGGHYQGKLTRYRALNDFERNNGFHVFGFNNPDTFKGFTLDDPMWVQFVEFEELTKESTRGRLSGEEIMRQYTSIATTAERTAFRAGAKATYRWSFNPTDPDHPMLQIALAHLDNKEFVK